MLRRLEAVSKSINAVSEIVVAALTAAIIVTVFVQVVFRYGLNASLSWSEELARYIFVWIIFIGTAVAARRNKHIAMEALIGVFPPRVRPWIAVAILIVSIGFFVLVVDVSLILTENARFAVSSGLQIPIAWVYAAAPIGAVLTLVHLVNALAQALWGTADASHATGGHRPEGAAS